MSDNNVIMAEVVKELTIAYLAAGRTVSKENVLVVAASLQDALNFHDIYEVRGAFKRAKDMADVPTQMVLKEALRNHQRERGTRGVGYDNAAPKQITSEGTRRLKEGEGWYVAATHCLAGFYDGMDKERAQAIVDEFEANPNNKSLVEYQRRWIANAKMQIQKNFKRAQESAIIGYEGANA